MRALAWTFFLLALGVVAFLALSVMRGTVRDPRELIANAERLRVGAEPDPQAALEELHLALRMAEAEPRKYSDLVGTILAARGELLASMGLYAQARHDLETVLAGHAPDDAEVQVQLASVLIEADEVEAALAILSGVLARDPSRADAWTLQSRALVSRADELLALAQEECREALPDNEEAKASMLLNRASGLELDHPARITLLHELRGLFDMLDEANAREALRLADEASERVTAAREALAESFLDRPSRTSLYDFLRLLDRSGRDDLALAFGLAAINQRSANGYPVFVRTILENLLRDGRPGTAVDVVQHYYARDVLPDMNFYRAWTEALYLDQQWKPLVFVGNTMRSAGIKDEDRTLASFYVGISQASLEQYFEAPNPLKIFVSQTAVRPFPGAHAEALRMMALCYREQGQVTAEKAALRGALDADAEADGAGPAWLRLADLIEETEPRSGEETLAALTHAMRLMPERTEELLPRWRELGQRLLVDARQEPEITYQALVADGRLVPQGQPGPYDLLLVAEMHAADGRPSGAAACTRRLLSTYPGFLPAVDLFVDSALAIPDHEAAARMLFDRVRRAGPTVESVDRLRSMPAGTLAPEKVLELMRLDPERSGRLTLVQELREEGRAVEALVGLTYVPDEELDEESRLLLAGLAFDEERYELAGKHLARIPEGSEMYAAALDLSLAIAVRTRDQEQLPGLIEQVTTSAAPDGPRLLATAEEMFVAGLETHARDLLERLDARPDTRDGPVMLRLAMAHWLAGDLREAEEHLLRAEAYDTGGGPEVGLLIRAVDERRWTELRWLVSDLESAEFKPTLLQTAVLDILRELPADAEATLAQGRARDTETARWTIVEGALDAFNARPSTLSEGSDELMHALVGRGGGDRDPRQILVRMLALEHPDWTAWAAAELGRARIPDEGSLWPTYLAALGHQRRGDLKRTQQLAQTILETWEGFAPGWDLLEDAAAAEIGRPDAPRLLRIQQQRRRALGRTGADTEVRDLRTRARVYAEEGQLEEALDAIRAALDIAPNEPENLLVLADLHRRKGEWRPALLAYEQACEGRPESSDDYMVGDFLGFLGEIEDVDPTLETLWRSGVARLGDRFDRDPLVALALARNDLDDFSLSPEVRLGRAFERLERFRASVAGQTLEELRPGSTRAWMEFYLERDPRLAHSLISDELLQRPGSIDLWRMLAETQRALGHRPDAVETLELLLRMLPDGQTSRAAARLLAEDGKQNERVRELVELTRDIEGFRGRDFELQLSLARSLANDINPKPRDRAIEILEDLWSKRTRAKAQDQLVEIGELYGLVLAWRGRAQDGQLAYEVLREVEPLIEDSARRNTLRAVGNLASRK